ncbi:MAG TPA: A24 family peptidase [Tepidisphaeraceae bacterium]|nr:A24 family peptidase [Tepidisphaeraceae bacterium]
MLLFQRGILPESFPQGEPGLEIDEDAYQKELQQAKLEHRDPPARPPTYTQAEIRAEIYKEILFLIPPLLGSLLFVILTQTLPPLRDAWRSALQYHWLTGLLGAMLGALIGGLTVWLARILGTLAFGRVAMGLGDVHLMFGVGAIVGAGPSVIAFFLAPFMGLLVGLWMLLTRKRHELPYGPYLSLATAAVVLSYCPIAEYLQPGLQGLAQALRSAFGIS